MANARTMLGIAMTALRRPGLFRALLVAAWRFRARGWWRRPPFLPLPPREYLEWRMHTAYGEGDREPTVNELRRYVRWANRLYSRRRAGRGP